MAVDTGQLQALTEQVARLADRVEDLLADQFALSMAYQAGQAAGEGSARAALLGRAATTTPTPTSRRARAAHLRPVDGGGPR
jgi:hypothetical protein